MGYNSVYKTTLYGKDDGNGTPSHWPHYVIQNSLFPDNARGFEEASGHDMKCLSRMRLQGISTSHGLTPAVKSNWILPTSTFSWNKVQNLRWNHSPGKYFNCSLWNPKQRIPLSHVQIPDLWKYKVINAYCFKS